MSEFESPNDVCHTCGVKRSEHNLRHPFNKKEIVKVNPERYIGYGNLLELPSGRIGIELTLNDLTELKKEMFSNDRIKILVLPVKEDNVTSWRTHSVKVGESKYKQTLIDEH